LLELIDYEMHFKMARFEKGRALNNSEVDFVVALIMG
jgi:hypothetical protein